MVANQHSFLRRQLTYLDGRLHEPASSYLFTGKALTGKTAAATYFISRLICMRNTHGCETCESCRRFLNNTHPDIHTLAPEEGKNDITIEQIHKIAHALNGRSLLSQYTIVLIKHADRLTGSAANALLKILEEPRGKTVFILLNNQERLVLPTIISRSERVIFPLLTDNQMRAYLKTFKLNNDALEAIVFVSKGKPILAEHLIEEASEISMRLDYYNTLIDNCIRGFRTIESFSVDKDISWSDKQKQHLETLDDYKRIWHNILLYKLGLDSYLKTYHNQKTLEAFVAKNGIKDIIQHITFLQHAQQLARQSVPGDILLERAV